MSDILVKLDTSSGAYDVISGNRRAEAMLQVLDGTIHAIDVETNVIVTLVKRDGKLIKATIN
jgi:hypothetical protein